MSTLAQQMFPGAPIEVAERAYSEASTAAAPGAVNVALAAGWGGGACNLVSAGALPAGLTYLEALVLVNAPATGLLPAEQVVFRRHALALQAAAGDPVLTADPASEDKDSAVAVKATGAIIMPEATLLADGDVVHVADPNSSTNYKINKTGTLFDPASTMINISGKSVGTIDTVAVASISNGQNLVLTDGVCLCSC